MYINQKSFLNMKQINKLLVILLALVTFSSCETYGDYEIEYTAIYPLCGEWVVNVTGEDGSVLAEGVTCNTYNTTDDAADKMLIKMGIATNDWVVRGKIHCDVTSKSFDGDGIANLLHADDGINSTVTFNISGKVIVDGYTTQANTKADAIEFTLTQNGKSMTVKGFRKTGWEGEDY